ncbi:polymorphic outer membrane protein middle domain-containing protein [Candidatus Chlamydia corallus]|uniref:polymorphic outer membrane protein middle domain-containing protein n=1 Tax=Candidatus Chlamydia corallus TaxID=2038470 RepID=UPI000C2F92DB|nr:polymorphic outer membrane protein middle domain-containing protein [Candidatus Chlamydia corallus]
MTLLRNLLTCLTVFLTLPATAQVVYLDENDSYNGSVDTKDLDRRVTCHPEGTSYIFLDDVGICNVHHNEKDSGVFVNQSGDLFFMGNCYNLTFKNLMTEGFGAAISNRVGDTTLTLSDFSILGFSSAPLLDQGRGAIYSLGSVVIKDNDTVTFCGNFSTWNGGAIYTPYLLGSKAKRPSVTLCGNRYMSFRNNVCQGYGGAIYTHNLNITTEGSTFFENNHAYHEVNTHGGAIAIAPGGSISISVKEGNLSFRGNTTSKDSNTIRSSIHLQSGARFDNLRAVSGSAVYFYDPVTTSESHTIRDLVINAPEEEQAYEGTIVFSGCYLNNDEIFEENLTSTIAQDVTLAGGTLSVLDGATLKLHSFKQEENSVLEMSRGSSLICSGDNRVLSLNILIEDSRNFIPARICAEENQALVSLDKLKVTFAPYWSLYDLSQFKEEFSIPLLELLGPSCDSLILSETTLDRAEITMTYENIQGWWSLTWQQENPSLDKNRKIIPTKKTIFLTWNPQKTSQP